MSIKGSQKTAGSPCTFHFPYKKGSLYKLSTTVFFRNVKHQEQILSMMKLALIILSLASASAARKSSCPVCDTVGIGYCEYHLVRQILDMVTIWIILPLSWGSNNVRYLLCKSINTTSLEIISLATQWGNFGHHVLKYHLHTRSISPGKSICNCMYFKRDYWC